MDHSGKSEEILEAVIRAIRAWHTQNITLDDCIAEIRSRHPETARSAASILFEYFRHKSFLDDLVMSSVSRGEIKPELKAAALCALTQALFQDAIARESAVNVAVEHIKRTRNRAVSGFLNAVIRNALRKCRNNIPPPSFPEILRKRWERNFGADAEPAIRACLKNPDTAIRIRKPELPPELADSRAVQFPFAPDFHFRMADDAGKILKSPAFLNGDLYIQDPATALSVSLCREYIRGRVLDGCAAPGGKTVMLYDLCEGKAEITAADRSQNRLRQMCENFKRLHLETIHTVVMDAVKPSAEMGKFQLVFLDAPCSNTGVARRRPDALWRFSESRLREAAALQKKILRGILPLVAEDGAVLYSTCSVEPEEDSLQIECFLKEHPEFELKKSSLLLPSEEHDGAFAALLVRNGMPQE